MEKEPISIWNKTADLPKFQQLSGDKKTEVLIIGGGMCGILCAYFLQKNGIDYILAEGGQIARGITGNTTAKITSQHGMIYNKLAGSLGLDKAKMYLEANQSALAEYKHMCSSIDCDFEIKDAYVYSLYDRTKAENEVRTLNSMDFPAEISDAAMLPFKTAGAVRFPNQAQFNPLKFIRSIAGNLKIFENTFIKEINDGRAVYDRGKITADKIIIATHFPFINKHGLYFMKLYRHRSYAVAFENAPDLNGMYVDELNNGISLRNYNGFLIIGGGGHRTGKYGGGICDVYQFAKKYYPKAVPKAFWAAQDCMSLDGAPYIGLYSKNTPNLYVASGFNKWGMTSSMTAAMILKDVIMGKDNEYAEVFSPQRNMLRSQLFINGIETIVNFLTPTPRRCPHLGCALKYNKSEKSWDCPCHGSRFDLDGKILDNPAQKAAKTIE